MPAESFSQANSGRAHAGRFGVWMALIVFSASLISGLILIGKETDKRASAARTLARAVAAGRTAAIEAQFSQAIAAAEALGAVARQNGGSIPNFQKLAADLLNLWPGLATIEVQPSGITGDIAPRAGYERAIGFNAFSHPIYRPGALETLQNRALTITGPLPLYTGMQGMLARVPLFQRGRDGKEAFSGFITVAMRLADALTQARLDHLAALGYDYALFVPALKGGKPVLLAARGNVVLQSDAAEAARIRNVELRLSVRPHGGWHDATRITLETVALVLVSALAGLLVHLLFARRLALAALANADQRLADEAGLKQQALADFEKSKATAAALEMDLKITKTSLQRAETSNTELQTSLQEEVRHSAEAGREAQARWSLAKQNISELQSRLDACMRAAETESQDRNAELEESRSMLEQALQKISEMQGLLEAASVVQNETAARNQAQSQKDQETIASLKASLEAAVQAQSESSSTIHVQSQKAQALVAELQERLASEQRTGEESRSKLQKQVQQDRETIRELEDRLESGSREAQEKIARLQEQLQQAQDNILYIETNRTASVPDSMGASASKEPEKQAAPEELPLPDKPAAPGEPAKPESIQEAILATTDEPVIIEETPAPENELNVKRHTPKNARNRHNDNQLELFVKPQEPEPAQAADPAPKPGIQPAADTSASAADETIAQQAEPPKAGIHAGASSPEIEEKSAAAKVAKTEASAGELFPEFPSTNTALLRKAVKQIMPLLADGDPGAADCFEDNRLVFRPAFTREGFAEFERLMKAADFAAALADLKKAAKKHNAL